MHVGKTTESDAEAIVDDDETVGRGFLVASRQEEKIGSDDAQDERLLEKLSATGFDLSFVVTGVLSV
jgi:hypothetical protein